VNNPPPKRRIQPGPGQESVWDYPRPPRLEHCPKHLRVVFAGRTVAETIVALRVCETSGPPTYYFPPGDVLHGYLSLATATTLCEWKGTASHYDLAVEGRVAHEAAWSYLAPSPPYQSVAGFVAFYPGRVDACYVDDELVIAQPGGYYGGWITRDIVGPFKGDPGTLDW
jgi:uncharacterized protein (DUF427 family)